MATTPPPSAQPYEGPPSAPPTQYTPGAAPVRFAGFWIRFLAYIIDAVVVGGITFGLLVATKPIKCQTEDGVNCLPGTTEISPIFYLFIALPLLYFLITWAFGGTLGQRILGLRVRNAQTGGNLGIGRSFLRLIGYLISVAVIYIGLIWAAFDARKQGWHDKIAGSVVVHQRG